MRKSVLLAEDNACNYYCTMYTKCVLNSEPTLLTDQQLKEKEVDKLKNFKFNFKPEIFKLPKIPDKSEG